MTTKTLSKLLGSIVIAGASAQAGCFLFIPNPDCTSGTHTRTVAASDIEFEGKLTPYGVQTPKDCWAACLYNMEDKIDYDYAQHMECWTQSFGQGAEVELTCTWEGCASAGRRPAGLKAFGTLSPPPAELRLRPAAMEPERPRVAKRLQHYAYLEAAAVIAFGQLKRELRAHRAPIRLIRMAERAQVEERRHAKVMTSLAKRWGGRPITPEVTKDSTPRTLGDIAMENALEGCIFETWGALLAHYQGEHATDPAFRAAMGPIAEDETRHASFSWALHRWIMPRLSQTERRAIRQAQYQARGKLESLISKDLDTSPLGTLGLPDRAMGLAMWRALEGALPFQG